MRATLCFVVMMVSASIASAIDRFPYVENLPGYSIEVIADGLPQRLGDAEIAPVHFGSHGGDLFVGYPGHPSVIGDGLVLRIDLPTGTVSTFAGPSDLVGDPNFLEFDPQGGGFPPGLYCNSNKDPQNLGKGLLSLIDAAGTASMFAWCSPPGDAHFYGGPDMAFSLGGAFGTNIFSGCSGGYQGDCISYVSSSAGFVQVLHGFGTPIHGGSPFGMVFGHGQSGFGTDLYWVCHHDPALAGIEAGIYVCDAAGSRSPFVTVSMDSRLAAPFDLEWGPGGAFGDDLYVSEWRGDWTNLGGDVYRIDSAGVPTRIIAELDMPKGLAFDGTDALYVADESFNANGGKVYKLGVCPGAAQRYGSGCAGTGGFVPNLFLQGCPTPGGTVTLTVDGGLGGAVAVLFLGLQTANIPMQPSCELLITPILPASVSFPLIQGGAGPGEGRMAIPAVIPAGVPAVALTAQLFTNDPATAENYANSNAIEFTIQ